MEAQLLTILERGYAASSIDRAVYLSSLASPQLSENEILDLPVATRDSRLVMLRWHLFGNRVLSIVHCTSWNTQLELSFELSPFLTILDRYAEPSQQHTKTEESAQVRLPTTRDLLAFVQLEGLEPTAALVDRCAEKLIPGLGSIR